MFNSLGILVEDRVVLNNQLEMNTAGYLPGVYLIRVETEKGTFSRTMTIYE